MFNRVSCYVDLLNRYNRRICGFLGVLPRASFFAWRPPKGHQIHVNFGDEIFRLIVTRIAGEEVEWCGANSFLRKVLVGGSAIDFARNYDIIWGAGLRNKNQQINFINVDVRAVRGPLTKEFFDKNKIPCPNVFGDPALLLPILFPEYKKNTTLGLIGYVPHFSDDIPTDIPINVNIISPARNAEIVIPEILKCESIISGSLHGIIVAEAFGIPAVWLQLSKTEPTLKYYDYYFSTDRSPLIAHTIQQAIEMLTEVKHQPVNFPDLNLLLDSFPREFLRKHHNN